MAVDSLERQQKGHMSSLRLFHSVSHCFCCCCYFIVILFILFVIGISMAKKKVLARLAWTWYRSKFDDKIDHFDVIWCWFYFLEFIFVLCTKHLFIHNKLGNISSGSTSHSYWTVDTAQNLFEFSNTWFCMKLPKCTEDADWISSPGSVNVHSSSGSKL